MNICVLCSAADLDDKYKQPAEALAKLIAEQDHDLIWGGSDTGLMNIIASGVQAGGGKIVGISLHVYKEQARKNADKMIVTKTLGKRKAVMLERSDSFIALPGGVGTLDELTDYIELRKHGAHDKPIAVLNTDNFYAGLRVQLQKMKDDGFLKAAIEDLVFFAETPNQALEYVEQHQA